MKKEQREVYLNLVRKVDWGLCSFCKYAECYGSCCSGEIEIECHHPLWRRYENPDDALQGSDCWGYRPSYNLTLISDIIGVVLQNGWVSANWWISKDNPEKYLVFGVK